MTTILIICGLAIVTYMAVCTIAGMIPTGIHIRDFAAESGPLTRQFANPGTDVAAAYRSAVKGVPGMSIAHVDSYEMLVDMKPTVMVMEGCFGMLLKLSFDSREGRTVVTALAQPKVPFAWAVDLDAAFVQAERALRMKAKRFGIEELTVRT